MLNDKILLKLTDEIEQQVTLIINWGMWIGDVFVEQHRECSVCNEPSLMDGELKHSAKCPVGRMKKYLKDEMLDRLFGYPDSDCLV